MRLQRVRIWCGVVHIRIVICKNEIRNLKHTKFVNICIELMIKKQRKICYCYILKYFYVLSIHVVVLVVYMRCLHVKWRNKCILNGKMAIKSISSVISRARTHTHTADFAYSNCSIHTHSNPFCGIKMHVLTLILGSLLSSCSFAVQP